MICDSPLLGANCDLLPDMLRKISHYELKFLFTEKLFVYFVFLGSEMLWKGLRTTHHLRVNNLVGILIKTRKSPWMKAERTAPRPLVFEIKWKFWGFTKCCQKPELHKNHWAKVREKHESVSGNRIGHVYHLLLHHLMFVTIFWSKVCSIHFYLETQWLESSVEILVKNAFRDLYLKLFLEP